MLLIEHYLQPVLHKNARILLKDPNGLIALEKPVGVLVHPNENSYRANSSPSILNAEYNFNQEAYQLKSLSKMQRFWLLNRIDAATSGIVLGSTNSDLAKIVKKKFKERNVSKTYYALVHGSSKNLSGNNKSKKFFSWIDAMENDRSQGVGDSIAETTVRIVSENISTHSLLLELNPVTGFKNQLRYQCALRGFPILGDRQFGDFALNKFGPAKSRLYLHAAKIQFTYTHNNTEWTFSAESPLPKAFTEI